MTSCYRHANRVHARRYAMQALYEHQMTGRSLSEVQRDYRRDREACEKMDAAYFERLLNGVQDHRAVIVSSLEDLISYSLDKVDPVERAVMLYAAYELLYVPEIAAPVVVAEAVKMNRKYGSEEGYRLVNGVLDRLAKNTRRRINQPKKRSIL